MNTFRKNGPTRRGIAVWGAVAALTLALAGCSGGSADTASSTDDKATVVDAMNPVTEVAAPTEAFEPPTDKHILLLICGSGGQGCVDEGSETKAVAESLGWQVDLVDGKLDPTVWNQVVKQAADSGVDGIISVSSDPNLFSEAMQAVEAKGIPFVVTNQIPRDTDVAGIDAYIAPDPVAGGEDVADWIVADSGGKANVLLLDLPGYDSAMTRTATIAEKIEADCPDCVIEKADVSVQTMGTSLAPLVTSRLQQNPDIDYVWSPDDCCVSFVQQGIQQAGRTGDLKLVSMGGFPDQLGNVGTDQLAADLATPTLFESWLSVDSLARLMAGQPAEQYWPVPQRLWTAANIADAPDTISESGWNLDLDYEALFDGLWGRS
ncbi:sugar ABC transporter substrate-binding protein [Microbacterium sp. RD1]|uniref:sugar ABC transporter substrate-binding protein n=1 Tax=Microbacterium sp. RD1 TaxID=3457313 RepID=UPI003FA57806